MDRILTVAIVDSPAGLEAVRRSGGPPLDVVLLESARLDEASDISELTEQGIPVLVYSRMSEDEDAIAALIDVITAAVGVPDTAELSPPDPVLSDQEKLATVLWLGSPSKQTAARRMGVSPHTIDMYIRRVRRKYESAGRPAPTKAELLTRAVEDRLVALTPGQPATAAQRVVRHVSDM